MRKILFTLICFTTLLLAGCSSFVDNPSTPTTEKEETIKFKNNIIERLSFVPDPGFHLHSINWLNNDNLIVTTHKFPIDSDDPPDEDYLRKIYVYNIINKESHNIYEGLLGTQWRLQIKNIASNQFGLQGYKGFVIFDKATFDIVKEVTFPDNWSDVDISSDGQKVAFRTMDGIFTTAIGSNARSLKVESNDNDHTYRLPTWSPDGERVAFFEDIGQKCDNGNLKIVSVDKIRKEFNLPAGLSINWVPDNKHIIACSGGSFLGTNASLAYIDTKTDQITTYEKEGQITVFKVSEDKVIYRHNPKNSQYSAQLIYCDIKTGKEEAMTPSYAEITTAEYSGNGDIAFVGKFNSQEPLTIYLISNNL